MELWSNRCRAHLASIYVASCKFKPHPCLILATDFPHQFISPRALRATFRNLLLSIGGNGLRIRMWRITTTSHPYFCQSFHPSRPWGCNRQLTKGLNRYLALKLSGEPRVVIFHLDLSSESVHSFIAFLNLRIFILMKYTFHLLVYWLIQLSGAN